MHIIITHHSPGHCTSKFSIFAKLFISISRTAYTSVGYLVWLSIEVNNVMCICACVCVCTFSSWSRSFPICLNLFDFSFHFNYIAKQMAAHTKQERILVIPNRNNNIMQFITIRRYSTRIMLKIELRSRSLHAIGRPMEHKQSKSVYWWIFLWFAISDVEHCFICTMFVRCCISFCCSSICRNWLNHTWRLE